MSTNESHQLSKRVVAPDTLKNAVKFEPPNELQAFLWNWLADLKVDRLDLLYLITKGELKSSSSSATIQGFQNEEPYLRMLASLPGVTNPFRSEFWKVLAHRLGDLFDGLAENNILRESLSNRDWSALIDLAHRACDKDAMALGVNKLQEVFDKTGRLPFPANRSLAREFSRLLGRLQVDHRFKERWGKLIRESSPHHLPDPTLSAGYLQAWQAYCLLPNPVTLVEFEVAARTVCDRVSNDFKSSQILRRQGFDLTQTPTVCMEDWKELVFAKLWNVYQWLPTPQQSIGQIACINGLAEIGQIIDLLRRVTIQPQAPLRLAIKKYSEIRLEWQLPSIPTELVSPGKLLTQNRSSTATKSLQESNEAIASLLEIYSSNANVG